MAKDMTSSHPHPWRRQWTQESIKPFPWSRGGSLFEKKVGELEKSRGEMGDCVNIDDNISSALDIKSPVPPAP